MSETVNDLKKIISHGILDGQNHTDVKLSAVVCDVTACAMIKETKQFQTSYHGLPHIAVCVKSKSLVHSLQTE